MDYWFQTDVIQFANGFTNIWPSDVHINVTNHPVVLQKCCQTTRRKMSSAGHLSKIIRMAMDKFQYFQCPNVESNRRWRKPTQVSDLKMVSFIPGFGKNFPCFPTHVPTCFAVLPCVSKFVRPAWFRDWNNVKKYPKRWIVELWVYGLCDPISPFWMNKISMSSEPLDPETQRFDAGQTADFMWRYQPFIRLLSHICPTV